MDGLEWLKKAIEKVNFRKYNIWRPPLERIHILVPTAAAPNAHVVVARVRERRARLSDLSVRDF